jgi:hypoxanthine phosphoribosyltransferase
VLEEPIPTPPEKMPQDSGSEAAIAPRRRRRATPKAAEGAPAVVDSTPQQKAAIPDAESAPPRPTRRRRATPASADAAPLPDATGTPEAPAEPKPIATRRRRTAKLSALDAPNIEITSDAVAANEAPVASGEAPKPTRRRRNPAPAPVADGGEEVPKPVLRRRRVTKSTAGVVPPGSTDDNVLSMAVEAPSSGAAAPQANDNVSGLSERDHSEGAADGDNPTVRRRRRGHRGGVGRRRQAPEQAVPEVSSVDALPVTPLRATSQRPIDGRIADEWVRGDRSTASSDVSTDPADWDAGDMKVDDDDEAAVERRRGRRRSARSLAEVDSTPSKTPDLSFMHPSEREFANLLDYYQIAFLYEPRSFPLRWDGNRVIEMHTPDFYLPEYDQYFELTTMKQSLVTQKNRKLRHVQELYPEINIQLLYRRDLMRLMGKYGFGPLSGIAIAESDQVLFSEAQIQQRVRELGQQIAQDYAGQEPVLIGVLRGVVVFMADLMRNIDLPMQIEFMEISHYGEEREQAIEVLRDVSTDIQGRSVIVIEDIVDTGLTLRYLLEHLKAKNPSSVKVCCLLDKSVRRMARVPLDYVGFDIPDEFVIGYGLDYGGRYRNLSHIGILTHQEPKAVAQR